MAEVSKSINPTLTFGPNGADNYFEMWNLKGFLIAVTSVAQRNELTN